jgi:hypothetical protein
MWLDKFTSNIVFSFVEWQQFYLHHVIFCFNSMRHWTILKPQSDTVYLKTVSSTFEAVCKHFLLLLLPHDRESKMNPLAIPRNGQGKNCGTICQS